MGRRIRLEDLATRAPIVPPMMAAFYQQNCMAALDLHNHGSGVRAGTDVLDSLDEVAIDWNGTVTDDVRRAYQDHEKRTDFAACAVALLIMPEFTGLTAVDVARKGSGVDYYLSSGDDDTLIFNHAAVLEISGIHQENSGNTVEKRVAAKRRRLEKYAKSRTATTEDLPTYTCVVEFSRPLVKVVLT